MKIPEVMRLMWKNLQNPGLTSLSLRLMIWKGDGGRECLSSEYSPGKVLNSWYSLVVLLCKELGTDFCIE